MRCDYTSKRLLVRCRYLKTEFKKSDSKKPDFKKDGFKKDGFKPPSKDSTPWTPPLDGGEGAPVKALKAKKANKRKANGKGGLF